MCLCEHVYCTFSGISKYQSIWIHLNYPNIMEKSIDTKKKKKRNPTSLMLMEAPEVRGWELYMEILATDLIQS